MSHDSHRIRKIEMRLMELEDEFKEFQKELVVELPPSAGTPLTDTDIHDMGCEIERQAARIAELEAQLGVTESTDSQKDHYRAGIRKALAMYPMDDGPYEYLGRLLSTEPKGTQ